MATPDRTWGLLRHGYPELAALRSRSDDHQVVAARLLGRPVTVLAGPAMTAAFYDDMRFTRDMALPGFVQDTLFGREAVHSLSGEAHRARKQRLLAVAHRSEPDVLVTLAEEFWERAAAGWRRSGLDLDLHEASAQVLLRAVCGWLDTPLAPTEVATKARWMTAMVDGFMPVGTRHLKARAARRRAEHWAADVITAARAAPSPRPFRWETLVGPYDDADPLTLHQASVELLNLIRPTTAVSWFVAFAAHAMHEQPRLRAEVADPTFARAFAHELRRYYPFTPLLGARATHDHRLHDVVVRRGSLAVLDVYGQLHDEAWWDQPNTFRPERFVGVQPDPWTLIPQGGGDVLAGHRCPGEDLTIGLLAAIVPRLAALDFELVSPSEIPLDRIPTRPVGGPTIRLPRAD